jgi:prepilin-type N-terminal cleavage/methylation domain-containing protein
MLKRQGTTLVEMAIVMAIVAIVALPVATLLTEGNRGNLVVLQMSRDQAATRAILDEVVRMARRATFAEVDGSKLTLEVPDVEKWKDPDPDGTNGDLILDSKTMYLYDSVDGPFKRTVGSGEATVFPDGLETGRITVTFSILSNVLTVTVSTVEIKPGGVVLVPTTTLTTQVVLPNLP